MKRKPPGMNARPERRAERRHRVNYHVNLTREEPKELEADVTNLSAGGCFVESGEEVREGDLVKLRFDIPGHGDLTVWGDIVFRVRGKGFGVHFSAFSQGWGREKLIDLLAENP